MTGPQTLEELHELASRPNAGVIDTLNDVDGDFLVLGAGGKMGFHLSAMLQRGLDALDSNRQVVAVSRFESHGASAWFQRYGIETISTDLLDAGAIASLPNAKNVFFLAGVKFGTANDPDLLHQMNVELPGQVAQRYAGSRVVALSTGCVYPFVPFDSGGSVETDPVAPVGQYAQSCLGREHAFTVSAIRTSLIRLNYSVDLRYGVLVDIAQSVLNDQTVGVTTGYANVIWQGDAGAYIIQALRHAATPPFILNVTGSKTLRIRDVAKQFGRIFDKTVEFSGSEAATAWLSNASRCRDLFGPPAVDEDTLIRWVADWLLAGGQTLGKPTHFEIRDGKF